VRYNVQHDEYCWLFALLKAGASQIEDTEQFGFRRRPDTAQLDLITIRHESDRAFWVLPVAHYERYMATTDLFTAQESANHG